jgi:hypothetical protein
MKGAVDSALIEVCRNERRALVTLGMGFANPLVFRPSDYAGIIMLRLQPHPTAADFDLELEALIGGLVRHEVDGKLWVVQRGSIREHQPRDRE